jgi:hypothetical protein
MAKHGIEARSFGKVNDWTFPITAQQCYGSVSPLTFLPLHCSADALLATLKAVTNAIRPAPSLSTSEVSNTDSYPPTAPLHLHWVFLKNRNNFTFNCVTQVKYTKLAFLLERLRPKVMALEETPFIITYHHYCFITLSSAVPHSKRLASSLQLSLYKSLFSLYVTIYFTTQYA